jgi:hypothetical protein
LTSSDRFHAISNLQPLGNFCLMLHWVDDVFDKH